MSYNRNIVDMGNENVQEYDDLYDADFPDAQFLRRHLQKINCEVRRKEATSWDLRLRCVKHQDSYHHNGHLAYMIEFGDYFKFNNCKFSTVLFGEGSDDNDEKCMVAIFDPEHPMLKLHLDNTKITFSPRRECISHIFSSKLFNIIIDYFKLKLPLKMPYHEKVFFYFKIEPLKTNMKEFKCKLIHLDESLFKQPN